jgi:peptidoglycan/xylan/chitin deacetylase (PgdA/CDA1 family)
MSNPTDEQTGTAAETGPDTPTDAADGDGDGDGPLARRVFVGALAGELVVGLAGCLRQRSDIQRRTPRPTSRASTATDADGTASDGTPADGPTETASGPPRIGLGPDTFERLSDLEVSGGSLTANTERNVTGTQCAELRTGSDGAWLHVPLAEPMDFENAGLSCYVAREGSAAGKFPFADLQDEEGNRMRLRSTMRSHDRLVRIDFGVFRPQVDGEPVDLANVTRVSFRADATRASGTETIYLDHLARVPAPETPAVVFMFDDANVTDYTEALPILSAYDYPAITYVVTENVGNEARLTTDHLGELSNAGWLVGSHTTDHTDLEESTDRSRIESVVRDAKQWLLDHGFSEGARHFAFPYDGADRQAMEVVAAHHDTGRASTWQPIAFPTNPTVVPGEPEPTVDRARKLLDQLVTFGGVLCIYEHDLAGSNTRERFRGVVDEVNRRDRAGDLEVVRLDELVRSAGDRSPTDPTGD